MCLISIEYPCIEYFNGIIRENQLRIKQKKQQNIWFLSEYSCRFFFR